MSPRKPKIQQQSWESANTPTINLYDPNREHFFDSEEAEHGNRKMKYNKYCLPNTPHQMSDPGTYYNMSSASSPVTAASSLTKSPKSPNQSQHFEFEMSSPSQFSSRSPLKAVACNRRYYDEQSTSDSASTTLTSPMKKFECGSFSPKVENNSGE
jgi:hypothetical protein